MNLLIVVKNALGAINYMSRTYQLSQKLKLPVLCCTAAPITSNDT